MIPEQSLIELLNFFQHYYINLLQVLQEVGGKSHDLQLGMNPRLHKGAIFKLS